MYNGINLVLGENRVIVDLLYKDNSLEKIDYTCLGC